MTSTLTLSLNLATHYHPVNNSSCESSQSKQQPLNVLSPPALLLFCRLLLATAGTDATVHLHVQSPGGMFTPAASLAGHENWIRSLAFCHASGSSSSDTASDGSSVAPGYVLLASASQDRCALHTIPKESQGSSGCTESWFKNYYIKRLMRVESFSACIENNRR